MFMKTVRLLLTTCIRTMKKMLRKDSGIIFLAIKSKIMTGLLLDTKIAESPMGSALLNKKRRDKIINSYGNKIFR